MVCTSVKGYLTFLLSYSRFHWGSGKETNVTTVSWSGVQITCYYYLWQLRWVQEGPTFVVIMAKCLLNNIDRIGFPLWLIHVLKCFHGMCNFCIIHPPYLCTMPQCHVWAARLDSYVCGNHCNKHPCTAESAEKLKAWLVRWRINILSSMCMLHCLLSSRSGCDHRREF